jgi:hypothetical protein
MQQQLMKISNAQAAGIILKKKVPLIKNLDKKMYYDHGDYFKPMQ